MASGCPCYATASQWNTGNNGIISKFKKKTGKNSLICFIYTSNNTSIMSIMSLTEFIKFPVKRMSVKNSRRDSLFKISKNKEVTGKIFKKSRTTKQHILYVVKQIILKKLNIERVNKIRLDCMGTSFTFAGML